MQKVQKERIVRDLESRLGEAKCLYLTDFTGLDVAAITELRKKLSEAEVEYVVVKNTLARRALAGGPYDGLAGSLEGPSAFAMSGTDVVSPAKILTEFARETDDRPRIKAGAIEGKVVSLEEIRRIAELPPREELLARLVGSARSPLAGLVWTLHGLLTQFVRTVEAVRARAEAEAPPAEPESPVEAPAPEEAGAAPVETAPEEATAEQGAPKEATAEEATAEEDAPEAAAPGPDETSAGDDAEGEDEKAPVVEAPAGEEAEKPAPEAEPET